MLIIGRARFYFQGILNIIIGANSVFCITDFCTVLLKKNIKYFKVFYDI